jgi:hypothetical protein
MGRWRKAGLVAAFLAAVLGAWVVAVPLAVAVALPSVIGRKDRRPRSDESKSRRAGHALDAAGFVAIVLGIVSVFGGGTFSPVLLLGTGSVLLLRDRLGLRVAVGLSPVEGSVLLRSRLDPFQWTAVVEVKASTRDLEGALSGLEERIVLLSEPQPRVFLVFTTGSLAGLGAEAALTARIRTRARSLAPLGVYLLPLEAKQALAATSSGARRIRVRGEGPRQFMSSNDFGSAVVDADHGFVGSYKLYSRVDGSERVRSVVAGRGEPSRSLCTLKEFLHEAFQRIGSPKPDGYVEFLSSMAATEGETLGQRMSQVGQREQRLLVESLGSPQVELTRTQLQAIVRVYE